MQATVFTDHQPLVSVPMEASLYRRLREIHGHTEVHDVYIPPWVTMFTVFVQMTPRWDGQARAVLLGALSSPYLHPKIAIAVDEDVDIYDPREVFWAMSTRVNPEKDVIVLPHERIHPLDVSGDETAEARAREPDGVKDPSALPVPDGVLVHMEATSYIPDVEKLCLLHNPLTAYPSHPRPSLSTLVTL